MSSPVNSSSNSDLTLYNQILNASTTNSSSNTDPTDPDSPDYDPNYVAALANQKLPVSNAPVVESTNSTQTSTEAVGRSKRRRGHHNGVDQIVQAQIQAEVTKSIESSKAQSSSGSKGAGAK